MPDFIRLRPVSVQRAPRVCPRTATLLYVVWSLFVLGISIVSIRDPNEKRPCFGEMGRNLRSVS